MNLHSLTSLRCIWQPLDVEVRLRCSLVILYHLCYSLLCHSRYLQLASLAYSKTWLTGKRLNPWYHAPSPPTRSHLHSHPIGLQPFIKTRINITSSHFLQKLHVPRNKSTCHLCNWWLFTMYYIPKRKKCWPQIMLCFPRCYRNVISYYSFNI